MRVRVRAIDYCNILSPTVRSYLRIHLINQYPNKLTRVEYCARKDMV